MKILVLAEPQLKSTPNATSDMHASLPHVLGAATRIASHADVYCWGERADAMATAISACQGVGEVLVQKDNSSDWPLAENMVPVIHNLITIRGYTHILMAATTTGKDILPRLAAICDVQMISAINDVVDASTYTRPIYAGNVLETVKSMESLQLISVIPTAFDAVENGAHATVSVLDASLPMSEISAYVGMESTQTDKPQLTEANIVVAGGRGIGSAESFRELEAFADTLHAAVGATRAAVDAGFAPNDWQIGQTGKTIAPTLYIAVGISGAIQHVAGIKDSKVIVAINTDPEAPIFEVADYGIVADWREVLKQWSEAVDS